MDRHFILATAGHVDHGKSALVQALTSTDPDRLPEEKQRGITIDLGFAALQLDSKSEPGASLRIGVIDVPGHEDFVKNMVAGVGCVNLGLIVVAADDGWMPQTEEHLQILEYLRVPKVVVALNKIDLAPDDQEFLEEVVRDELKGSSFADAPIVATSTVSGQGIDDLRRRVTEQFEALESPVDTGRPRLSVDRTFVVKGHGTVVTGTLTGGCLEEGQAVVVQPSGLESRVRGLQSFGEAVNKAHPGSRVAVNLANLSVKRSGEASQEGVTRGDVVVASGMELGGQIIDCLIEKSHRLHERKIPAAKPLKHGLRVRLHHGSDNVPGRLFFLDQDALVVGETSPAQIRVEQSIALLPGDRFVVRDWAEMHTLAGGVVVNTPSNSREFRSLASRRFFAICGAEGDPVEQLMLAIIERDRIIVESTLLAFSCYSPEDVGQSIERLLKAGQVGRRDGWLVEAGFWSTEIDRATAKVHEFHDAHPELLGITLSELRSYVDPRWLEAEAFPLLLDALMEKGLVQEGTVLRRSDHAISLPSDLIRVAERLRSLLGEKSLEPPGRKQLIVGEQEERAMRFLLDSGEVVEVSDDLVFLKSGFDRLIQQVRDFLLERGGGTVSELRQHTGVSRRVMLPVLEYLDTRRVTVRDGDVRRLASA